MPLGVSEWDPGYWLDYPYLNGSFLSHFRPVEIQDSVGSPFTTYTHAGTSVATLPYRINSVGALLPRSWDPQQFTWTLRNDDEDDWIAFKRARSVGGPVSWCIGGRQMDAWDVGIGDVCLLSRAKATGIGISGVTEVLYPTVVYLDGVVDATAVTWSGTNPTKAFTAAKAGLIEVYYMPYYRVIVKSLPKSFPEFNLLTSQVILEEYMTGACP